MQEDWYTAQPIVAPAVGAVAEAMPAAYELRPLSLSEVLDRTFGVYRSRFWLFAGIASFYAVFGLALNLLNLLVKHFVIMRYGMQAGTYSALGGAYVEMAILIVPAAIMQATTVYALSEVYLGRSTTAVGALRTVAGRWYRYVGIALWLSWSFLWLPFALFVVGLTLTLGLRGFGLAWLGYIFLFLGFCAIFFGVWAGLRNMLGVQACVIEGATVRTSMRRSKVLTEGAKWRIVVVLLIALVLIMAAGFIQAPLVFLVMRAPLEEHIVAQSCSLLVGALAQAIVTPVWLIGLSLVYFDQRVRQEGFDLLMMLGPEVPSAYAAPAALDPTHGR